MRCRITFFAVPCAQSRPKPRRDVFALIWSSRYRPSIVEIVVGDDRVLAARLSPPRAFEALELALAARVVRAAALRCRWAARSRTRGSTASSVNLDGFRVAMLPVASCSAASIASFENAGAGAPPLRFLVRRLILANVFDDFSFLYFLPLVDQIAPHDRLVRISRGRVPVNCSGTVRRRVRPSISTLNFERGRSRCNRRCGAILPAERSPRRFFRLRRRALDGRANEHHDRCKHSAQIFAGARR